MRTGGPQSAMRSRAASGGGSGGALGSTDDAKVPPL